MKIDDEFIKSQKAYLQDLISFKEHPYLLDDKDKIGFGDWEHGRLAYVTRKDALSVLKRVLDGELTIKDYYDWSVSISGRSTIGYEKGYQDVLIDIVDDIITIYESRTAFPIPENFVQEQYDRLQNAKFDKNEKYDDD
jgi:hypothetical protein